MFFPFMLLCPACKGELRIVSFITLPSTVEDILLHLDAAPASPGPPRKLRRVGIVAAVAAFEADLAVARLTLAATPPAPAPVGTADFREDRAGPSPGRAPRPAASQRTPEIHGGHDRTAGAL